MAAPDTDTPTYFILASLDDDGRRPVTIRTVKSCTPEKHRDKVEQTLQHLVDVGEVLRVKKDTYLKHVKLR